MRLTGDEARSRLMTARVATLATVREDGAPHLVPIVFAVLGDAVVHVIDHKAKDSVDLARLANVRHEPRVALLAHGYDDDWSRLWWVRADATADVFDPREDRDHWERAVVALALRYRQYREVPPTGPVVWAVVRRWTGWAQEPS